MYFWQYDFDWVLNSSQTMHRHSFDHRAKEILKQYGRLNGRVIDTKKEH